MADGAFYDVTMLVPVSARVWADSEDEAKQFVVMNARITVANIYAIGVGFPQEVNVKEFEEPTPLRART